MCILVFHLSHPLCFPLHALQHSCTPGLLHPWLPITKFTFRIHHPSSTTHHPSSPPAHIPTNFLLLARCPTIGSTSTPQRQAHSQQMTHHCSRRGIQQSRHHCSRRRTQQSRHHCSRTISQQIPHCSRRGIQQSSYQKDINLGMRHPSCQQDLHHPRRDSSKAGTCRTLRTVSRKIFQLSTNRPSCSMPSHRALQTFSGLLS